MMLILNRLRGTEGLWSKVIGLLLALVVQIAFGNPYVSILVGLGYIIGESFGLEFRGGGELQEGAYGLMQDLVLITLGVSYVIS